MQKLANERLDTLKMSSVATQINVTMEKRIAELLGEIEDILKRVNAKKTLHIRLTQEERAAWVLFGKNKKER